MTTRIAAELVHCFNRASASHVGWLAAATVFASSTAVPAAAQQTDDFAQKVHELAPEVRPMVVAAPNAAGGQPVRRLKTTFTSSGTKVLADRVVVQLAKGVAADDESQIHQEAASLGAGAAKPVLQLPNGFRLVDVSGARSVDAAVAAYRATRGVLTASPSSIGQFTMSANDPLLTYQTGHLNRIGAALAWDRTQGAGSRIAILDSGIGPHPDLDSKVDDQVNTVDGSSTADDLGHGTAMAGLAAAATNNMIGIAGIGYDARLLNVKISVGDEFDASSIVQGIYWATDHGAHVINMSFSSEFEDCTSSDADIVMQRQAIEYAWSRNVVLVASAGNTGGTIQSMPASCPHVLSVAYTDNNDVMSQSSSHGTWVDIAAPGTSTLAPISWLLPAIAACNPLNEGSNYAFCSGTSPAAAIVSGVAALVRTTCSTVNQSIAERITSTADPITGTGTNWQFGRINAASAVCIPQPTLIQTGATSSSLSYSWDDRSTESYFEFWYQPYGASTWTTVVVPADTTQYTLNDLQMGAWYAAKVRACDARGCSEFSSMLVKRVNFFQLNITRIGGGTVTSTPAGIDCRPRSTKCAAVFEAGRTVQLDAIGGYDPTTRKEYDFDHWEGACSGPWQTCMLTVTDPQPTQAVAVFVLSGTN